MTVQTQDRKEEKAGGQENLTFSFKTIPNHPEHIQVTLKLIATGVETQLVYNTDYTVTLQTDGIGGTAAVLPTFGTEYTQTVWRDTTDKQESDYADYNQFPAETLENDLDRLMCLSQEALEDLDRSVKVGISSDVDVTLPAPEDALVLAWSGTGGTLVNVSNSAQALAGALDAQVAAELAQTGAEVSEINAATSATDANNSAVAAAASAASFDQTKIEDDDQNTGWEAERTADDNILYAKTAGVDRTIITANGEQTMPTQPCFLVHPASAQMNIATGGVTVIFGTERFDKGGNFSANVFTAPVTGNYLLSVSLALDDTDSATQYQVQIVTSNKTYIFHLDPTKFSGDLTFANSLGFSVVADMDASDTVSIVLLQTAGAVQTDIITGSYFSGTLSN